MWLNSRSSLPAYAVPWTLFQCCSKFGEVSCTVCTGQGNDFELIPTLKMETRLPFEGSFGNKCPSVYNRCGVMAAWGRKICWKNFRFFRFCRKKDPLCGNFQNYIPKGFITTPIDVLFKFCEIWPTGNRWNRTLLTWKNKISPGSQAVSTVRITPKVCQGLQQTRMYSLASLANSR